jgi:hypothetical protein
MKNYDGNVIHLNTSGVLFLIVTLAVAMDKRRAVLTEWNELGSYKFTIYLIFSDEM